MDSSPESYFNLYRQFATAEGKSLRTIESYIEDTTAFIKFLGGCHDIRAITEDDLRRYILHLQQQLRYASHPTIKNHERLLSEDTIASYVRGIKAFWSWMYREGFISENTFERIKPPKLHEKVVESLLPDKVASILDVIPNEVNQKQPDRSIILTLYGTGGRISEIISLPLIDVNFDTGQLTVTAKGGSQRALFMSPVLYKVLFRYRHKVRPESDSQYFFLMASGTPVSRFYIEHKIREYAHIANLGQRAYPHLLRFSFAIQFLRNGGDPFTLQKILGHRSLDMTKHYVRLANTDVEKSLKKYSPIEQLRGLL